MDILEEINSIATLMRQTPPRKGQNKPQKMCYYPFSDMATMTLPVPIRERTRKMVNTKRFRAVRAGGRTRRMNKRTYTRGRNRQIARFLNSPGMFLMPEIALSKNRIPGVCSAYSGIHHSY